MFMHIASMPNSVLFTALDTQHIGNLRMVNRTLARCISLSVCDKIKKAAETKYERLVKLDANTIRIYSRLGRTSIELILPNGTADDVAADIHARIFMRLDGRLYGGNVENLWWQHTATRDQSLSGHCGYFHFFFF